MHYIAPASKELQLGHTETPDAVSNMILTCADDREVVSLLAEPLRRHVGADGVTILAFRRGSGGIITLDRSWSAAMPPGCHEQYSEGLYRRDPMVINHLSAQMNGKSATADAVATFAVKDLGAFASDSDDQYIDEFWNPYQLRYMAGMAITPASQSPYRIVVALHRFAGAKPFTEQDISSLRPFGLPVRAVFHALTLEHERRHAAYLTDAIAECFGDCGLVVIDGAGTILYQNRRAGSHWADDDSHRAAITTRAATDARTVTYLTNDAGGGKSLQIVSRTIPHSGGHRVIVSGVVVGDVAAINRCSANGLSRRETEVALAVMDGLSNCEIANLLGISIRTVENHLRSIFETMGVANRTRLTRMLLTAADR